ncbi:MULTISPECIES: class I SAM-dependent methyltransferase [unclassified Leucobacter]|uniref:methyltransferase n=1 Tax=unclassified Leucobacter TaxID=2621730 RepID=UPI001F1347F9|nr:MULTISPECIES: class I SAM-dependent methyltransferase [unclassified Leucobacter]
MSWEHDGSAETAAWWSTNDRPAPKKMVVVDDRLTADQAVKYAAQGTAMLWLGDFHNAKQILSAIDRRLAKGGKKKAPRPADSDADEFYRLRQARAQRSRMMSLILVPLTFDADGAAALPLPRAPRVDAAVAFGYSEQPGFGRGPAVVSLQELTGVLSAHQWFVTGVEVPSLGAKIYPRYGTFLPTRHEYVDLVAQAPLPSRELAFDIGTGTGVLAAVLAHRGVARVVGTDIHQRAVDCANDNFSRLGIASFASAELTSMFPEGRAPLVVCNPPWLPGAATTSLDAAVYDPGSQMLLQFLGGLSDHLTAEGEGWLILSDLAEHLGLRSRQMLLDAIEQAGLVVIDRLDTVPTHGRASDASDILHAARSREVTSLWRLRVQG